MVSKAKGNPQHIDQVFKTLNYWSDSDLGLAVALMREHFVEALRANSELHDGILCKIRVADCYSEPVHEREAPHVSVMPGLEDIERKLKTFSKRSSTRNVVVTYEDELRATSRSVRKRVLVRWVATLSITMHGGTDRLHHQCVAGAVDWTVMEPDDQRTCYYEMSYGSHKTEGLFGSVAESLIKNLLSVHGEATHQVMRGLPDPFPMDDLPS